MELADGYGLEVVYSISVFVSVPGLSIPFDLIGAAVRTSVFVSLTLRDLVRLGRRRGEKSLVWAGCVPPKFMPANACLAVGVRRGLVASRLDHTASGTRNASF
jgi:hypothetical protein